MVIYRPNVADWGAVGHGNKDARACSVTLRHSVYFLHLQLSETLDLESYPPIGLPVSVFGSELRMQCSFMYLDTSRNRFTWYSAIYFSSEPPLFFRLFYDALSIYAI